MSKKYEKKYKKILKKKERAMRRESYRTKNLQLKYGVGHLYFYKICANCCDFGFSKEKSNKYNKVKDMETLKRCLFDNIPILDLDNNIIYSAFEEYQKEQFIIKLACI